MCLGVPGKVIEIRGDGWARVASGQVEMDIRMDLVPEAAAGDFVIVHAGYAIHVLDTEEAAQTLRLLEERYAAGEIQE